MEINLKEGEVLPVTSDRMFKAILMDSKEYLADILSNILDIDKNDFNIILCNFQRVKDKVIYFVSENLKRTKDKETRSIVKNIKNIKNTRRRIDVLIKDDDGRITDIETKGYALYKIG